MLLPFLILFFCGRKTWYLWLEELVEDVIVVVAATDGPPPPPE